MAITDAKHRFLLLLYLTCFVLSLAPTIVAPPEKGFSQGQPEKEQSMDNMVGHGVIIKKSLNIRSDVPADYPSMLSYQINSLLSEAEQRLSSIKDSNEKQRIEDVVHQMKALAETLEKASEGNKQALAKPESVNPRSGTPVPEGLPLQPTLPVTSAVPELNPFQKPNRMVSKFTVTSPELSQVLPVNEYPSDRQVVTKPAVSPVKKEYPEDDELVRELESLPNEFAAQSPVQKTKEEDETPRVTTAAANVVVTDVSVISDHEKMNGVAMTSDRENMNGVTKTGDREKMYGMAMTGDPEKMYRGAMTGNREKMNGVEMTGDREKMNDIEMRKAVLKARLIQEITQLQRLGETIPEEVLKTLNENNQKTAGPAYKNSQEEIKSFSNTLNGMVDETAMQMLDGLKNEDDRLSKTNLEKLNSEKSKPYQDEKHFQQTILNHTFQNTHLYMPVFPRQMVNPNFPNKNRGQLYPKGLQNAIQDLQKPNPFNFHGRYPAFSSTPNQQVGHIPDGMRQRMFYNGYPATPVYNEYLARNGYGPYPYMHQWDKNGTLHLPPGMSPYIRPSVNHQIDTQLSDEMKRQLRDGKIVVLSDSVVRSNFEQNEEGKSNENNEAKPENAKNNTTETRN